MKSREFIKENKDPTSQDLRDVAEWMNTTVNKLQLSLINEPIGKFLKQIKEMYNTYDEFPKDAQRTQKIVTALARGENPLPIYVSASDNSLFVMEGRHRMVAFWLLGLDTIPVNYVSVKQAVTEDIVRVANGWKHTGLGYRNDPVFVLPRFSKFESVYRNKNGTWQDILHYFLFLMESYQTSQLDITGNEIAETLATMNGRDSSNELTQLNNCSSVQFSTWSEILQHFKNMEVEQFMSIFKGII